MRRRVDLDDKRSETCRWLQLPAERSWQQLLAHVKEYQPELYDR